MRIAMAIEGPRITTATLRARPVGGTEAAFAVLAAAFARRGHAVEALAGEEPPERVDGVAWRPLAGGTGAPADMVISARVARHFEVLPPARTGRRGRILWLFNPCQYLRKPRHLWPILKAWPVAVTLGPYHDGTLSWWMPLSGRAQLPLPVAAPFDRPAAPIPQPPPPVAIFASNPTRGLDWLLDAWEQRIRPAVPEAELHCYTGAATYGGNARLAGRAAPVMARAAAMQAAGVRLLPPTDRHALARTYRGARAMLYRGDLGETYCLSLAEAQSAGLPCVVTPCGSVAERVVPGETGVVARDPVEFAAAAIRLLRDDAAWSAMHRAALARGPAPDGDAVAAAFEALAG
ncbi:glycosyltransferase family 4 protein [Roseicella aquatilis]|uniref:Glycosyltransferase family 1 protein n=1 Tax=Roseicella aquatilis TaxID=2527868 RepID=A0A4V2WM27_9PROT|nr:glycosyltransferase [Roseicella aquatilis]TCZ66012.1 glycosyltransferase family 1 protein [Roseicella aquatilis]